MPSISISFYLNNDDYMEYVKHEQQIKEELKSIVKDKIKKI